MATKYMRQAELKHASELAKCYASAGFNPHAEQRPCLAPPPHLMDVAAELLDQAVDAVISGDLPRAIELLREADMPDLHAYSTLLMSAPDHILQLRPFPDAPPHLSRIERPTTRMPAAAVEREVYRRDGYRCRYCGCRVVLKAARSVLTALFPGAVRWPGGRGGDKGKHGAFYALNSVIDHVVPHARGGDNSPDNLVTACWPCNFGKEDYLLEELGLADPRTRSPIVGAWDGLERIISARGRLLLAATPSAISIRHREPEPQTRPAKGSGPSLDEWLRPIDTRSKETVARLRQFLTSLPAPHVGLSINQNILVNVGVGTRSLAVFGIDPDGNVDVPWSIGTEKELFKPFATALAEAIPGAKLYETTTMWRVTGLGTGRGQISIEELLDCQEVTRDSIVRLVADLAEVTDL